MKDLKKSIFYVILQLSLHLQLSVSRKMRDFQTLCTKGATFFSLSSLHTTNLSCLHEVLYSFLSGQVHVRPFIGLLISLPLISQL